MSWNTWNTFLKTSYGFSAITLMAFGVDRILGLGAMDEEASEGGKGLLISLAVATGLLLLGTILATTGGPLTFSATRSRSPLTFRFF